MANPAPRRLRLRRSTVRAAPAGHIVDCSCDPGNGIAFSRGPTRRAARSSVVPRPQPSTGALAQLALPAYVVVIPVVAIAWSPAGEVTMTLAAPVPGEAPEMSTSQVAVPVASVVSSGETIGPRPWMVTVKVTLALASGSPSNDVARTVSFNFVCDAALNLLGATDR